MNPKDSTVFRISDTIYVRKKNIRNTIQKKLYVTNKKFHIVKVIFCLKGSRNELD